MVVPRDSVCNQLFNWGVWEHKCVWVRSASGSKSVTRGDRALTSRCRRPSNDGTTKHCVLKLNWWRFVQA